MTTDRKIQEGVCPNCETAIGENYDTCPVCGQEELQEAWNPTPTSTRPDALQSPCAACGGQHKTFGECMNPLAQVIDILGAIEVAPETYAYPTGYAEGGRFRLVSTLGLEKYQAALREAKAAGEKLDGNFRRYFHQTNKLMPAWWTPERKEVWRLEFDDVSQTFLTRREAEDASDGWAPRPSPFRVTASLETGEEVS